MTKKERAKSIIDQATFNGMAFMAGRITEGRLNKLKKELIIKILRHTKDGR